jgi:hypothetical protein
VRSKAPEIQGYASDKAEAALANLKACIREPEP